MQKHPVFWTCLTVSVLVFLLIGGVIFFAFKDIGSNMPVSFDSADVAVIKIEGTILESLDTLKKMERIREGKSVKAVVIRLDSPGGAVAPSQEIYSEVLKLKKDGIKVVASMGTVAASGAYYIACASDKIVANPGTVTGSIGVIMETFGMQELIKRVSLENRVIKSGTLKDAGNPFRDMTPEERTYFQNLIDNLYGQFLNAVSENRKIDREVLKPLAQGQVFSGEQAKELGLIDDFGTIYDAIDQAKQLAGLPEDAEVQWPREPSAWEKFWQGDDQARGLVGLVKNLIGQKQPLWMMEAESLPQYRQ